MVSEEAIVPQAPSELRIVSVMNGVFSWVLHQDGQLVARRNRLPIGTSLIAVAYTRQ